MIRETIKGPDFFKGSDFFKRPDFKRPNQGERLRELIFSSPYSPSCKKRNSKYGTRLRGAIKGSNYGEQLREVIKGPDSFKGSDFKEPDF